MLTHLAQGREQRRQLHLLRCQPIMRDKGLVSVLTHEHCLLVTAKLGEHLQ